MLSLTAVPSDHYMLAKCLWKMHRHPDNVAKDLGVFNIAGALPFTVAPAMAPVILTIGHGSYSLLYAVAGICAIIGGAAILPVKRVR